MRTGRTADGHLTKQARKAHGLRRQWIPSRRLFRFPEEVLFAVRTTASHGGRRSRWPLPLPWRLFLFSLRCPGTARTRVRRRHCNHSRRFAAALISASSGGTRLDLVDKADIQGPVPPSCLGGLALMGLCCSFLFSSPVPTSTGFDSL